MTWTNSGIVTQRLVPYNQRGRLKLWSPFTWEKVMISSSRKLLRGSRASMLNTFFLLNLASVNILIIMLMNKCSKMMPKEPFESKKLADTGHTGVLNSAKSKPKMHYGKCVTKQTEYHKKWSQNRSQTDQVMKISQKWFPNWSLRPKYNQNHQNIVNMGAKIYPKSVKNRGCVADAFLERFGRPLGAKWDSPVISTGPFWRPISIKNRKMHPKTH